MPSDIEGGIAAMFRDATEQSAVLVLRNAQDWERFNALKDRARQKTQAEVDDFARNQPKRLAAARKAIIDQAGARNHDHPAPFGGDKFDKARIDRQARTLVANNHQKRHLAIQAEEATSFEDLKQDIRSRDGIRGLAQIGFARAIDRRMGPDRRAHD